MITRDTIKAIPATYEGIRFRSKMEAKFAKWCDKNKQKWIYEPEGLTDGKQAYLPDFYLPDSKMIVEIKPVFFLGEAYKVDLLLNNQDFDKFALAVIEVGRGGSIEVLKYSPPEKDFLDEEGIYGRFWSEKYEFMGSGFCTKCNAFHINISRASWACTGCGNYDGDLSLNK